jgi:hypothetical protein
MVVGDRRAAFAKPGEDEPLEYIQSAIAMTPHEAAILMIISVRGFTLRSSGEQGK